MTQHPQVILDIHRFADNNVWTCISKKAPLKDDKRNIAGCINQMSELNIPALTKLGINLIKENTKKFNNQSNSLLLSAENHCPYKLSKRESECLFYLLRGSTAKETAKILEISSKTVEYYIENLKNKFTACTRAELISKAIEEGYLTIIPLSVLPNNLSKAISFNE